MKCQKCGYIRQPSDDAPNWKCPMCDVVYAKSLAQGSESSVKAVMCSSPMKCCIHWEQQSKYNLATGRPLFPEGYAEPELQPRYPQKKAELMGAYIPISSTESIMPKNLHKTRVGEKTAQEIGWNPL